MTSEMTTEETNGTNRYGCASAVKRFRPVTAEIVRLSRTSWALAVWWLTRRNSGNIRTMRRRKRLTCVCRRGS